MRVGHTGSYMAEDICNNLNVKVCCANSSIPNYLSFQVKELKRKIWAGQEFCSSGFLQCKFIDSSASDSEVHLRTIFTIFIIYRKELKVYEIELHVRFWIILVHFIVYSDYCFSHEHSSLIEKEMSEVIEEHILKRSEHNPNGILTAIGSKTYGVCRT